MPSNAISGVGTVFKRNNIAVAEVTGITGPNKSRGTIDVTSLDSTDGYKEFIGTFRDGGTVTVNMNFIRATYDDFNDDFESEAKQDYDIVMPDTSNTTFSFSGLVTDLGLAIPMEDKVSADVSIKISGPVTLTT